MSSMIPGYKRHSLDEFSSEPKRFRTQSHTQSNQDKKTRGRVKIEIKFIEDKQKRCTTFSKRKAGLMKKSHELATLTGSQVMVLVASETGHVYTFSTEKFRPILNSKPGRKLIQTCLANESVDEAEMGDIDLAEIDPVAEEKSGPLMMGPGNLALPGNESPGNSSQSSNEAGNLSPPHGPEFRTLVVQRGLKTSQPDEPRKRPFEHALKPRIQTNIDSRITEIDPGEPSREPGGIRYAVSPPNNHILTHNNDVPSDEEIGETAPIPTIPDGYQLGAIHPVYLRQTKIPHSAKDGTEYEMTYLHQGASLPPDEGIPNHVHLMHKSRLFKAFPPHSSHSHSNLPHSSKR